MGGTSASDNHHEATMVHSERGTNRWYRAVAWLAKAESRTLLY